jgi:hypothetical protein
MRFTTYNCKSLLLKSLKIRSVFKKPFFNIKLFFIHKCNKQTFSYWDRTKTYLLFISGKKKFFLVLKYDIWDKNMQKLKHPFYWLY